MALNTQVQQARDAGYTDSQIADYLGSKYQLPVERARKEGYDDKHIVEYLSKRDINKPSSTPAIDAAQEAGITRAQGDLATGRPELDLQTPQPPVQAPPDRSVLPTGREALGALQGSTLNAAGGLTTLVADELAPEAGGARITPEMRSQMMAQAPQNTNGAILHQSSPQESAAYFDQLKADNPDTAQYFSNLEQQNAARRELPGMRETGRQMVNAGQDVLQDTQPQNPGMAKRVILGGIKSAPMLAAGVAGGLVAGPGGAAAAMGGASGGESYGDVLSNPNMSEDEKQRYAIASAGLSTVFNAIPVTKAFQPGVSAVKRFLASAAINVPAQEANTIAQHVLDIQSGAGEHWTDTQWAQAILDSAAQAGVFSAAHTGTSSLKEHLESKQRAQVNDMSQSRPDLEKEMFGGTDESAPATKQLAAPSTPEAAPKAAPKKPAPKAPESPPLRDPESAAPATAQPQTIDRRTLDVFKTDDEGGYDVQKATDAVQSQVKTALDNGMVAIQHSKTGLKKNSFIIDDPTKVDVQSVVDGKSRIKIVAKDSPLVTQLTKGEQNERQDQTTGQGRQASLLSDEQSSLADKAKEVANQSVAIKPTDKGFTLTVDGKPTAGAYTTFEDAKQAQTDLLKSMATGELNKKPEVPAAAPKKEKTAAELQREMMAQVRTKPEVAPTPEKIAPQSTEVAKPSGSGKAETVKLYRGVGAARDPNATSDTVGGALFYSPLDSVAEKYAGEGGKVVEKQVEFKNRLDARRWTDIKKKLNLPTSATMRDVISEAKKAGYDGMSFSSTQGVEYVHFPVETAAHEAATSPRNELPAPTPAQMEAGNYPKGHLKLHGLDISIENPKGSIRSSKPGAETPWQSTMQAHYGYIRGTVGKDKDHLDVFVGPHADDADHTVFVFDQPKFDGASFDEHKIMLGFETLKDAKEAYAGSYDKAAQPMVNAAKVSHFSMDEFKKWLADGDHQQPASAFNPRVKAPVKAVEESSVAPQSAANSNVIHSKNFTDLLVGLSRAPKGFGSLDVKTQRMMVSTVLDSIHDLKVRSAIVSSVPASVMDKLTGKKGSSQLFLHDPSVLRNTLSESKAGLPVSVNGFFDALGKAPASVRAKLGGGLRSDDKESGAASTGSLNLLRKDGAIAGGRAENTPPNGKPVSLDEERNAAVTANNTDTLEGRGVTTRSGAKVSGGEDLGGDSGKLAPALNTSDDRHNKKIISDFGEKIEGARKDYAAQMKDALSTDVTTAPLSESWPEPNYAKLLEGGADHWAVSFMHAARDEIPTKPKKSWKLSSWVKQVEMLRNTSFKLANGEYSAQKAKDLLRLDPRLSDIADRMELYQAVGHDMSLKGIKVRKGSYSVYAGVKFDEPKTLWTVEKDSPSSALSNWPRELARAATKEEAIAQFKAKYDDLKNSDDVAAAVKFSLYSDRRTKEIYIGKKVGKNVVKVRGGFDDVKTARKYIEDNHQELVDTLAKMKDVPYERRTDNSPRVGADHRSGASVTPEHFTEQFGFRGVQFGNYVENERRQQDLNQTYDALMDMAAIIDVPPKALSLNGELGLAFGARGQGGKNAGSAHYEPQNIVINLTKHKGAGSLAHEWFHGLDNYFSRKFGGKLGMMTLTKKAPEGMRPEVFHAFQGIVKAIQSTGMTMRAEELDSLRSKPYWATVHEMAARSFESYVIAKLHDNNGSNDYLANVVGQQPWNESDKMRQGTSERYPYPMESEMPTIRGAFDNFFNVLEHKQEGDKIALHDLSTDKEDAIRFAVDRTIARMMKREDVGIERRTMVTSTLSRLRAQLERGDISESVFAERVADLHREMLFNKAAKRLDKPERITGPDYIRERLLQAKRRGLLDERGVAFAEWFIKKNPALLDEVGISVVGEGDRKASGTYYPIKKLIELSTMHAKPTTAVHEMLHHLEQLMPPEMQDQIRKEYWRQLEEQRNAAIKSGDTHKINYFESLTQANMSGDKEALKAATKSLMKGEVPGSFYQYFNPSEFWAVNATHLLSNRYSARHTMWSRIRNWVKEALEHIKKFFGKSSYSTILKAADDLFAGKGLKETSGDMLEPKLSPRQYQDINTPPPKEPGGGEAAGGKELTTWVSPEKSKMDSFIYDWQDKHIDLKRVTEAIENAKKSELDDEHHAYRGEELYHQRTAYRVKRFLDDELRPLLESAKSVGVSPQKLEHYLWARHAPERNETIEKRNPGMTNGSGMETSEAQKYMASLSPTERQKLETLAQQVDRMIDNTRKTLVGYGLESQATVDMWKAAWPHYVPLHREDFENDSAYGIGQGFSVKGSSTKSALGSQRPVANVLAEIALQRERAVVRGEKNRVSLALYGLAKDNPNPGWWSATRMPVKRYLDKKTGTVVSVPDPNWKNRDNVIVTRFPNNTGKIVERGVVFNERNPRAMRMAMALKNLDADQLGGIIGAMSKVSRYISAINTQYDPLFGLWNLGRDLQGGLMNATATPIRHEKAKITRYALQSIRGIWQDARAVRHGEHPPSEWSKWFEEMEKEGGTTGYRDLFKTSKDRADAIVSEFSKLDANYAARAYQAVKGFLSDYNLVCESAVRVAAYRTAREKGLSKAQSASISKNLTINFNRKGRNGQQANALYSFFNARVQGTARLLQTLAGPAGKSILAGGLLLGAIQAIMLAVAGYDDNDPPEFVKQNNFVIPVGGGKYVMWNTPQEARPLLNLGRIPTEYAIRKTMKASSAVSNLFSSMMDAFNPMGTSTFLQTILPTAADPIGALAENKQWTGKQIFREKQDPFDPTPGFSRSMDTATAISKVTARGINQLSGGTDYVAGTFSPTPDQIDYLLDTALGGPGRLISKVEQTASASVTGDDIPLYKVPLLGKIIGTTTGGDSKKSRFYDLVRAGRENMAQMKGELGEPDVDSAKAADIREQYLAKHPEFKQSLMAVKVEEAIVKLRSERRLASRHGAPRSKLHEFDSKITELMDQTLNAPDHAETE